MLGFVILDFAVWAEHWASHKIPLLWRIHKMHHADRDIDVTTALRFHPLEILISMAWKAAVVVAFGIPSSRFWCSRSCSTAPPCSTMPTFAFPGLARPGTAALIVTPDMHRVHHSVIRSETDSTTASTCRSGTGCFAPMSTSRARGHTGMTIGLAEYQTPEDGRLSLSLALPFRRPRRIRRAGCRARISKS
ncbi:MAG: sterol desaturase family protein [Alphaproteobacteria bacterium]|nr:sterol desaturase family protein [Alphaproteobacteria bacterium]